MMSNAPYSPQLFRDSRLAVEIQSRKTMDVTSNMMLPQFADRVHHMREFSRMAPGSIHIDPFAERISWFKVIGRGFALLKNLLYDIPLIHTVFVVDEKGIIVGKMIVSIQPGAPQLAPSSAATPGRKSESFVEFETCEFIDYNQMVLDDFDDDDRSFFQGSMARGSSNDLLGSMASPFSPAKVASDSDMFASKSRSYAVGSSSSGLSSAPATYPLSKRKGEMYQFTITIVQVEGLSSDFGDVFCQFRFHNNSIANKARYCFGPLSPYVFIGWLCLFYGAVARQDGCFEVPAL